MVEVDLTGVEEATDDKYPLIPEGQYLVRIEKAEQKQSAKGKDYFALQFNILDGDYAGKKLFDMVSLSSGALGRLKLVLSHLEMENDGALKLYEEDFVGKCCMLDIYISDEEYPDKDGRMIQTKKSKPSFAGYIALTDKQKANMDDLPF